LGLLYEQAGQFDKARGAYERALKNNPNDIVALNNLAYAIAVREHKPADALPMAERAFANASGAAGVADTLGWIKHLLGDDAGALPLVEAAANSDTANAEMRVHLAVIYAARGRLQDAAKTLEAARALDPSVEQRDDYRAAKKQIGGLSPGAGR
jgi:Flp pilus assembly protein TadD